MKFSGTIAGAELWAAEEEEKEHSWRKAKVQFEDSDNGERRNLDHVLCDSVHIWKVVQFKDMYQVHSKH